jgi:hypothetical protein
MSMGIEGWGEMRKSKEAGEAGEAGELEFRLSYAKRPSRAELIRDLAKL